MPPTPTPTPEPQQVASNSQGFLLQDLTVTVGATVTWVQKDATTHTSTSGTPGSTTGVWDSGFLSQDQTFSFTFTEAGTFPYFCQVHPFMTVTVTDQ